MPAEDSDRQTRAGQDTADVNPPAGRPREPLRNRHPKQIGPYRVLSVLGEGGMGVVYLAEQQRPIRRRVAVKIIKLGMDTRQVIARFETEREALAVMNHPNVAKVFDAGATETGRPYFVMEYVPGVPITEYCDRHRLNTEERLHLFMDVCHAVQHAHQKGIIHRDLKPSNVLVSVSAESSPAGRGGPGRLPGTRGADVKVIDFGVAKATQHRLTEQTIFTEQGQLIGTPGYMSPEQAEMSALDVDTRTDVYSLGVLLYELLVGTRPFDDATLLRAGFAEIQRVIREVDPPRPSTRFGSLGAASTNVAQKRRTEVRTLSRQLRGDLDWIVMKCLEKDRTRRYDTANGIALEIHRYLNDEPVLAGPPGTAYRLRKFVARNRAAVLTGALFIAVLAGATIGMTVLYVRADLERQRAEQARINASEQRAVAQGHAQRAEAARRIAERINEFLNKDLLGAIHPNRSRGRDVTVREVVDAAAQRIDKLSNEPAIEAAVRLTIGSVYHALALYGSAEQHLETALQRSRDLPDEDRLLTASILEQLASVRFDQKRLDEFFSLLRAALEIRTTALGEDHPDVIRTRGDLVHAEQLLGQPMAFDQMLETYWGPSVAFATIWRTQPLWDGGPAKLSASEATEAIAERVETLRRAWVAGRVDDARETVRSTLLLSQEVFGFPTAYIVNMHTAAAALLHRDGRTDTAHAYLDGIVAFAEESLGPDHTDTLNAVEALARLHRDGKRYTDATRLLCTTLVHRERILGTDHPETKRARLTLQDLFRETGEVRTAEVVCAPAGSGSPTSATTGRTP